MARLVLSLLFAIATQAFKISFYNNGNCAGEFVGTWIGGKGQGCNSDFIGISEGVVVQSTGPVDDNTIVQFYSSHNCRPGTETTEANGGCVAVDDELVGAFKSYRVIGDALKAKPRSRRTARSPQSWNETTRLPSPQPLQARIEHGQYGKFEGIEYRWQQVHATGWVGVLPEEWDDEIHSQNTTNPADLPIGDHPLENELDERALVQGLCEVANSCVRTLRAGTVTVANVANPYFAAAGRAALARGQSVVTFLNEQPFFAQVIAMGINDPLQALVGAKISGNDNLIQLCSSQAALLSTQAAQIDALISIIKGTGQAATSTSLTVSNLRNDAGDEVSTVTMTVTQCGLQPTTQGCNDVDPRFCPA